MNLPDKLPAEFKANWIAALRSGKYRQSTCYLNTANGFCCLGVACDIVDPTTWKKVVDSSIPGTMETKTGSRGYPGYGDLGDDIMNVLLQEFSENGMKHSVLNYLASLNDNCAYFIDIAAWIEENL